MDLNEKKASPAINENAAESLTKSEMEKVTGGTIYDDIRNAAIRAVCQSGRHFYETNEQRRVDQGGALFVRKVSVCKVCGHTDFTGWSPLGHNP